MTHQNHRCPLLCRRSGDSRKWPASSRRTGCASFVSLYRLLKLGGMAGLCLWCLPTNAATLTWDSVTGTNISYRVYGSIATAPFVLLFSTANTTASVTPSDTQPTRYFVTSFSTNYATPESEASNIVTISPPPPPLTGLSFQAEQGVIAAPFYINGTVIQQDVQTTVASQGGRASYTFTITNAGTYTVSAMVNAPDGGADSVFVNIDSEPGDANIWSIPNTVGFEKRTVRFAGETNDHAFALTAMQHVLIFRGREAGCQIDSITVAPTAAPVPPQPIPGAPPAPTGLKAVQIQPNRIDLSWTTVPNAVTEVERSVEGAPFSKLATVTFGVYHYSDTSVRRKYDYRFRARAVSLFGVSGYSNEVFISSR